MVCPQVHVAHFPLEVKEDTADNVRFQIVFNFSKRMGGDFIHIE
jgi:hypothetical protein